MIGVIAAAEKGKVVILDISGAYLHAKMPKIVQWRMRGWTSTCQDYDTAE